MKGVGKWESTGHKTLMTKAMVGKFLNRAMLNKHQHAVKGFIQDLSDDALAELWETMGEVGIIITNEMRKRNLDRIAERENA